MTQVTTQVHRARPATLGRVLLHRRGVVHVPQVGGQVNPAAEAGVQLLEADLLDRGWLLSPALRDALLRVDTADLVGVGSTLVADCDALLGADRNHTPLFRRFPDGVPENTWVFFVERVLAYLLQEPEQPCVLCGADGKVAPVNPCGHLVCHACFAPADFSACPICHRHLDPADPYLRAAQPTFTVSDRRRVHVPGDGPRRLRVLHLSSNAGWDARVELAGLLNRPGALPPGDVDDLNALLAFVSRDDLSWLPARIPGRETKARVLAWLLADPAPAEAVEIAAELIDTATDVLRLLVARSGGESLIDRPRLAPVPRPLRRALLAAMDTFGAVQLVEDMRRHPRAWIAAGERLHPGEYAARWPAVAAAFAALRGTNVREHPAGHVIAELTAGLDGVRFHHGRVRVDVRARLVEEALAAGDVTTVLAVLRARPGELLRRADHLLRIADDADRGLVVNAVGEAAARVAPAVLLSALGEIRTRTLGHQRRVFFPAGRSGTAHVVADTRPALPVNVVAAAERSIKHALFERAGALPPVDRAVVDTDLDGVVAPFAERTAARALVTLPRGSVLPIPAGQFLRLFLHWMESGLRVDLDLSVAIYNAEWRHVGTCDYTSLRVAGATHSGDFTSAPAPRGATEFIDLDVDTLASCCGANVDGGVHIPGCLGARGRYAVMSVLSYNDVPFTDMAEAFAGFMVRDDPHGEQFDPRTVEQRFDLTGPGKLTIPLVVDLQQRTMRWLDVAARVTGTDHAVHRHGGQIGIVAQSLLESFDAGGRVTLGDLGRWIAAARAREVVVRGPGGMALYRRQVGESVAWFALRLRTGLSDAPATAEDAATAALQFLVRGDLPAPAGAQVYALHPAGLDAGTVRLLAASDVAGLLAATG